MRIRHLFIAITLILTFPFHLLGNDQLDPNLCYTPGGSTRAPDWLCGVYEDVDGYSEETKFAVGQSGRSSNPNELLAEGIATLVGVIGLVRGEGPSQTEYFEMNDNHSYYFSVSAVENREKVTAKVIDKFSAPMRDYILVAEAPEGITYDLSQVLLSKKVTIDRSDDLFQAFLDDKDTSGFGDHGNLHSSFNVSLVRIDTVENGKNSMLGCFLKISEGVGDDELFVDKELDTEECRQEFVKMSFTLAFAKKERARQDSFKESEKLYQQFLSQKELDAEVDAEVDAAIRAEFDKVLSDNFDTMTGTIADLQGNWSTSCTAEDTNSLFTIERLVISGNTLYREEIVYPDSNCESPIMQLNGTMLSVKLDGSTQFTDETSGYKVSGKLLSADITVLNSDFASALNEQSFCGIDSWEKDVAFDIFGKNCGDEDKIIIKNAVTYAAYRVTGNNLYFESSESEYPTSLDENKIYVKQ